VPRKRQPAPTPGDPSVAPEIGVKLLEGQISTGRGLLNARPIPADQYSRWELITRNHLEKCFGANSPNVTAVTDIGKYGMYSMDDGEREWERRRAENLTAQLTQLDGLVELLKTEATLQSGSGIASQKPSPHGHRIFLVHGHNEAILQEVARFLERLEQDILILREQPSGGRTIIEKFEDYSDVGFAVILLTGDDRGGVATASLEEQQARSRQNVILELGYFLGRLGRARVCALYQEGVEIPSDYSGVLYVKLDPGGGWRLQLAKELKAANLIVDMNNAL